MFLDTILFVIIIRKINQFSLFYRNPESIVFQTLLQTLLNILYLSGLIGYSF